MFLLTRLLAAVAWATQRAAWRIRGGVRLPARRPTAPSSWTVTQRQHASALSAAGREFGVGAVNVASRAAIALSLVGCCLYGLTVGALAANRMLLRDDVNPEFWRDAINRRLQRLVVDRDQRPIGVVGAAVDGTAGSALVPEACIDLVLLQEDRHHAARWRHFNGVDIPALMRAALGQRGAGTLPMQVARVAGDLRAHHSTFNRKRLELAAAAEIIGLYGGDIRALARDYLLMAPFAVALNGGGGEVSGLVAFSQAMFRKPAAALTVEQCAIGVAALPTPLWFNDPGDRSKARHQLVLARAERLLGAAGKVDAGTAEVMATLRKAFPITGAETLHVLARRNLDALRPLLKREVNQP
jgi:membrane carboxypeptidase/penicillin-binding protein PbpC